MLIGYMRVSKADGSQVLDLQHDALIAAGVEPTHIYEDKCSGSKDDRPGLAACLRALRKDDVLVIWKLDRLGRNLRHLIETIDDLTKRGVGFKVLQGAPVDTTTSQGKLMFTMFAALAEFEHDVIRERTIAGLAAARARGREGGRKSAFDKNMLARAQAGVRDRSMSINALCAELGISKPTLYRNLTPEGELTEAGKRVMSGKRAKLRNGNGKKAAA
ncbi:MAG: recombinase family protein [Rhodomicrobium sp.]